jgi:hypothetical protein
MVRFQSGLPGWQQTLRIRRIYMDQNAAAVRELNEIMQNVNLVRVSVGCKDIWEIAPVLYCTDGGVELILEKKEDPSHCVGEGVILKFQRAGFEYLVKARITDISVSANSCSISVVFCEVHKYYNLRKHMRFEAQLNGAVDAGEDGLFHGTVRNISRGGALIEIHHSLVMEDVITVRIGFEPGRIFQARARVLRRLEQKTGSCQFGLQFLEMTHKNRKLLEEEIFRLEISYLKSIYRLKKYENKSNTYYDTKIAIFSPEEDENCEIREVLIRLGAENFEIFRSLRFHSEYFLEEKPSLLIVEMENDGASALETLVRIRQSFPGLRMILILPLSEEAEVNADRLMGEGMSVLYKPLIYNEFEQEIIKYL